MYLLKYIIMYIWIYGYKMSNIVIRMSTMLNAHFINRKCQFQSSSRAIVCCYGV